MKMRQFMMALAITGAVAALPMAANAQGGGGGGRGGFGGGQFGGGMGMQREPSLANVPIGAMVSAFSLTGEQKQKIEAIRMELQEQMRTEMENMRNNGGGGGGFDPQAMREMMQQMQGKMQAADTTASNKIVALFTPEQRQMVTPKMAEWKMYQQAGLPIDLAEALKLTDEQRKALAEYVKTRPQGRPGGPGGFGGGRPGGGAPAGGRNN